MTIEADRYVPVQRHPINARVSSSLLPPFAPHLPSFLPSFRCLLCCSSTNQDPGLPSALLPSAHQLSDRQTDRTPERSTDQSLDQPIYVTRCPSIPTAVCHIYIHSLGLKQRRTLIDVPIETTLCRFDQYRQPQQQHHECATRERHSDHKQWHSGANVCSFRSSKWYRKCVGYRRLRSFEQRMITTTANVQRATSSHHMVLFNIMS